MQQQGSACTGAGFLPSPPNTLSTQNNLLQVYEKKVSCLTDFNVESRNGLAGQGRVPAIQPPQLRQPLHLPKVRCMASDSGDLGLWGDKYTTCLTNHQWCVVHIWVALLFSRSIAVVQFGGLHTFLHQAQNGFNAVAAAWDYLLMFEVASRPCALFPLQA